MRLGDRDTAHAVTTTRNEPARGVIVRGARWLLLVVVAGLCLPAAVTAQPVEVPPTYGGDFWTRPRLSGDWFGFRDEMGKRGVTLDLDLTQVLQGNGTGGRSTGVAYDGLVNYELNVDTGKLGLWPGGFLRVKAFSTYGDFVDHDSGATLPVNFLGLLPQPDNNTATGLMNLTFMQFFSKWFGVYAGKVYALGGDDNAFAHDFNTQFLNTCLNFNCTLGFAPWTAYGGGLVLLPWEGAIITAAVLDPSGTATNNDISEAFHDGQALSVEGRATIQPFGLVGHQDLGFLWVNKTRASLEQVPPTSRAASSTSASPGCRIPARSSCGSSRALPGAARPRAAAQPEEQHLERLLQLRPVPLESGRCAGPRGRPLLPVRGLRRQPEPDQVRLQRRLQLQRPGPRTPQGQQRHRLGPHPVQQRLRPLPAREPQSRPQRRDAVELYYNAVITPWLNVTADLQIVNSALNKDLNSSGQLVNIGTAVVGGLRAYVRF